MSAFVQWERGKPMFKATSASTVPVPDAGQVRQKFDEPSRVDARIAAEEAEAKLVKAWDAEVDRRDGKRCRACGKASDPNVVGLTTRGHRAHIQYASAGGTCVPSNRVTLCYRCHNDEHKNRLRFTDDGSILGVDANAPMEFWRKEKATGTWYLARRETSVGVVEKD